MSTQRLTPLEAVTSRQVNAWNGITTPEHRINWPLVRKLASMCKDRTGIEQDAEVWKRKTVAGRGECFYFAEFHDITRNKVVDFFRALSVHYKQLILSLVKFPFGIHRCYVDAHVLEPGYVSDHSTYPRFFNQTGWMHFIDGFFHSTDIGWESIGFTEPIQTLLGQQLSHPPSVILDGCRGMDYGQAAQVGQLVLTALVHDRLLEKPLYQGVLGLTFQ
jgi:hypothetical protein